MSVVRRDCLVNSKQHYLNLTDHIISHKKKYMCFNGSVSSSYSPKSLNPKKVYYTLLPSYSLDFLVLKNWCLLLIFLLSTLGSIRSLLHSF